jgi:transcriptional regulator with XRE-family HTH domain
MKERIKQIMEHEGLKPSEFAEAIGIKRAAISHYMSGRNEPSLDVVKRIHETFPFISIEWLLYGKGEMLSIGNTIKHHGKQLDMFADQENGTDTRKRSPVAENRPTSRSARENRREMVLEAPLKSIQSTEREDINQQKRETRKVSKIMVFYSDSTFETFTAEK